MWRGVAVKTPPAVLPLAAADLAESLRVEDPAELGLIEEFLGRAVAAIDGPTGIGVAICAQVWTLTLDRLSGEIDLPGWPVTGVAEIRYLDAADAWQVVPAESYRLVTGTDPAVLLPRRGAAWPAVQRQRGAVQIDYTLGAADPAEADKGLVGAAALIAGHYYENRAAVEAGPEAREIPMGAAHILAGYRRGLAGG